MAVQLLEDWLLKEQEKIITTYRELNQAPLKEPGLIFIGDSIVEYFPIHELLQSPKHMVNRGVRGYKTDLLHEHLDAHVFGTAVDQIFLLIGTNDIGKEIPSKGNLRQCRSGLTSNYAGLSADPHQPDLGSTGESR